MGMLCCHALKAFFISILLIPLLSVKNHILISNVSRDGLCWHEGDAEAAHPQEMDEKCHGHPALASCSLQNRPGREQIFLVTGMHLLDCLLQGRNVVPGDHASVGRRHRMKDWVKGQSSAAFANYQDMGRLPALIGVPKPTTCKNCGIAGHRRTSCTRPLFVAAS